MSQYKVFLCASNFLLNIPLMAALGRSRKSRKGAARTLASYIDPIYFAENSLKLIQNFTEKGVGTVQPLNPPMYCILQPTQNAT